MKYTAYLHNLEDNCRLHLSSKDSDNRNGQNTDCRREYLDTGKDGRTVLKKDFHSNHRCICQGKFFLLRCSQEKLTLANVDLLCFTNHDETSINPPDDGVQRASGLVQFSEVLGEWCIQRELGSSLNTHTYTPLHTLLCPMFFHTMLPKKPR